MASSLATNAAHMIARKGKAITLTRSTPGMPDPATPWLPGTPTLDMLTFRARVTGTAAEYVDGTEILASDLMVIAGTTATHTLHDGEPADGAVVDLAPQMSDTIHLDGTDKVIKKILPATDDDGATAVFRIFVAS